MYTGVFLIGIGICMLISGIFREWGEYLDTICDGIDELR